MDPLIQFTSEECRLIQDTQFFRTKAIVTQKVKEILQRLHVEISEEVALWNPLAPDGVDFRKGQFVKGEHLLDFPYLYLDLPKFFSQSEKFTFRSLFWWGHHFIFALFLEGSHLESYKSNLMTAYEQLAQGGFFLLMTDTPWEWRKEPEYLLEIRTDNRDEVATALASRRFLKLQRYIEFDHPAVQAGRIVETGRESLRLIKPIVSGPSGG